MGKKENIETSQLQDLKKELSSLIDQMQVLGIDPDEIECQFRNAVSKCQSLVDLYNSGRLNQIQKKLSEIGISHKKRGDGIYFLSINKYFYFYFKFDDSDYYYFCVEDHMELVLRELRIEKPPTKSGFSKWLSKCIDVYYEYQSLDYELLELHNRAEQSK